MSVLNQLAADTEKSRQMNPGTLSMLRATFQSLNAPISAEIPIWSALRFYRAKDPYAVVRMGEGKLEGAVAGPSFTREISLAETQDWKRSSSLIQAIQNRISVSLDEWLIKHTEGKSLGPVIDIGCERTLREIITAETFGQAYFTYSVSTYIRITYA